MYYDRNKDRTIRLMTYNIHRWEGRDGRLDVSRLADVIRATRADVVALNEVLHPIEEGRSSREPLAELAGLLGMSFVFGASGWLDHGPGWEGKVGNALLSRFPISGSTNAWLPRIPGTKQRSMLGAQLDGGPAKGLGVYVTHLDHAFEGTRLFQVEGVLHGMMRQGPHFLAGDFNTPGFLGPRTRKLLPPVLRRLRKAGYQDAFGTVGAGDGRTFPAVAPIFRIDFLFLPRRWATGLSHAETVDVARVNQASDHRPVLAEWSWPEEPSLN